jgi:hypothetical protein
MFYKEKKASEVNAGDVIGWFDEKHDEWDNWDVKHATCAEIYTALNVQKVMVFDLESIIDQKKLTHTVHPETPFNVLQKEY